MHKRARGIGPTQRRYRDWHKQPLTADLRLRLNFVTRDCLERYAGQRLIWWLLQRGDIRKSGLPGSWDPSNLNLLIHSAGRVCDARGGTWISIADVVGAAISSMAWCEGQAAAKTEK